jgi:hypothetical protein
MIMTDIKTKRELRRQLDDVIDKFKDSISDLEDLLRDLEKAGIRTDMYREYILNHIKAVVAGDYGFIERETLDEIADEIDEMPDNGCPTDEDED